MTRAIRKLISLGKQGVLAQKQFRPLSTAANVSEQQTVIKDDHKLWVKSPYPDVQPVVGVEMHEILFSQISKWPQLQAMECGMSGKKYTYKDLYQQSRGFGAALINAGLKKGDIIGVVLPNIPEFAIVLLGAWSAGLTVSCVNPAYTGEEIKRQLKSSDACAAVTIDFFLESVKNAKSSNPMIKDIIIIGDCTEGCHTFSEMVKCDTKNVEFSTGSKGNTLEDIALLPYSSGTTGPPKGVKLSSSNITTNLLQFTQNDIGCTKSVEETGTQERLIGILPYFHSYGSAAIVIAGIFQGASTYCLPRFDPATFLQAVKQHKPTTLHLVTPLISHIVNSKDYGKNELSCLQNVVGAAAPIGQVLINRILEKAGKDIFFAEGYGMTELSPLSHILNPSSRNTKVGSCGRAIPSTYCKIIDTKIGNTLGANCRGELLVKGPQVMKGYYKNEDATRNTIDADGWLHTGDIAYYDEDGFFYIVDRLKELIKVKGFQVAPSELEDILREHKDISDVAVIGVPDEESGEVPRAYIVRKSTSLTENDVHEYLKPIIASFKRLKGGIEFRNDIPKAPSGKILRRELVDEYRKKNSLL